MKPIIRRVVTDMELKDGKHIHTDSYRDGEICQGGDPECPLWNMQLDEAMEVWSGS
jgi:hypothetical protein